MSGPFHELPDVIELTRSEYRAQHAALEAALYVLDTAPNADPEGRARRQVEVALALLLHRIWPFLDDLDADV